MPRLKITFDVFRPNRDFKRTATGVPAYRVSICKYTDPAPTLADMQVLIPLAYPSALKFAVVRRWPRRATHVPRSC